MVGPQLYLGSERPYYQTGLVGNMAVLCIMFCLCVFQVFYITWLNKRNAKRRAAMGKTGPHVDYSLENSSKWADMKAARRAAAAGENGGKPLDDEEDDMAGLEDKTDLENEMFVYSL